MNVEPLSDEREWDEFVAASPDGTFFHTLKWKAVLEKSFPYEHLYLCIRDSSDELVGICPFFITQKFWPFRVLDSLPNSDLGGPLFKGEFKRDAANALINYLNELGIRKGISYAKMRLSNPEDYKNLRIMNSKVDDHSGTMILDLDDKPLDFIWNNIFEHKQRKYINRFERDGFSSDHRTDISIMKIFHALYINNWGDGGALSNLNFLENIFCLLYPKHFSITLIGNGSRCIGAGINYIYDEKKTIYMGGVALDKNMSSRYKIYYKLRWETIKYAHNNGYRYVSLGPTSSDMSEDHHKIKSKFGAEFSPDYCLYMPINRELFFLREIGINFGRKIKKLLPNKIYTEMGRRLL